MATETKAAGDFRARLIAADASQLEAFAAGELLQGTPHIFRLDGGETERFQRHVAQGLGIPAAFHDVLVVGSAKTGFSLDPEMATFAAFSETSDIDVAVVNEALFDEAWATMIRWEYRTIKVRSNDDESWLRHRQFNVFGGWHDPIRWNLHAMRNQARLSFPEALKSLRTLSQKWFNTFRGLGRYRHIEVPRHRVDARTEHVSTPTCTTLTV